MSNLGNIGTLLVSILMVSIVATGLSMFYVDLADNPEYNISRTFYDSQGRELQSFKQINTTLEQVEGIKDKTEQLTQTIPVVGTIIGVLVAAYDALMMIFSSFFIFQNMITDTILILGLPDFLGLAIMGIIIITIIFTILAAAVKWRV